MGVRLVIRPEIKSTSKVLNRRERLLRVKVIRYVIRVMSLSKVITSLRVKIVLRKILMVRDVSTSRSQMTLKIMVILLSKYVSLINIY